MSQSARSARRLFTCGFLCATLSACAFGQQIGPYDVPESEIAASEPWPSLLDVPEAPPPGTYTRTVPDPQRGSVVQRNLKREALRMREVAALLAAPVLSPGERARLRRGVTQR